MNIHQDVTEPKTGRTIRLPYSHPRTARDIQGTTNDPLWQKLKFRVLLSDAAWMNSLAPGQSRPVM